MNKIPKTYRQQVEQECLDMEITAYFLVAFFPGLIGYAAGEQLIEGFTDNAWANILVPVVFCILFAFMAIIVLCIATSKDEQG